MQVEFYTRMVGHTSIGLIAGRHRLPPEVLVPVFERMVDEGYLTRGGSLYQHTQAGRREAATITTAWSDWLNQQLEEDTGRPRSAELRAAVDTISKRLLAEDLAHGLPEYKQPAAVGS